MIGLERKINYQIIYCTEKTNLGNRKASKRRLQLKLSFSLFDLYCVSKRILSKTNFVKKYNILNEFFIIIIYSYEFL